MAFNPMQILKLKDKLNAFRERHPGFSRFINAVRRSSVTEGAVIDVKITYPDGKTMTSNFRLVQDDIELIRMIGQLKN